VGCRLWIIAGRWLIRDTDSCIKESIQSLDIKSPISTTGPSLIPPNPSKTPSLLSSLISHLSSLFSHLSSPPTPPHPPPSILHPPSRTSTLHPPPSSSNQSINQQPTNQPTKQSTNQLTNHIPKNQHPDSVDIGCCVTTRIVDRGEGKGKKGEWKREEGRGKREEGRGKRYIQRWNTGNRGGSGAGASFVCTIIRLV